MTNSIPIFVISLQDSTDRREKIAKCLNDLRLPFEFLDAVDGRNGLPADHEAMIDRHETRNNRPLVDTEFACALSHMEAYRRVIDRSLPHALILEDDAMPLPELVPYLSGGHFDHADLTQLCYSETYVRRRSAKPLFDQYKSYPCVPDEHCLGAVAYIVSNAAASHILNHAIPINNVADWPDCTEHFKRCGRWNVVYPRLVEHPRRGHGNSIIGDFGRSRVKRRFLGIYVPPMKNIARSWVRRAIRLTQVLHMKKIRR